MAQVMAYCIANLQDMGLNPSFDCIWKVTSFSSHFLADSYTFVPEETNIQSKYKTTTTTRIIITTTIETILMLTNKAGKRHASQEIVLDDNTMINTNTIITSFL